MEVICDIETDALINPTKIWLIVCKEVESGKRHVFKPFIEGTKEFRDFARSVSTWIGHNFLGYDAPILNRFCGDRTIDLGRVVDTLVISRLLKYNYSGGHSLDSWGERLGSKKIKFSNFSSFSEKMLEYCLQDVEINYRLYTEVQKRFIDSEQWKDAIKLEHEVAIICNEMHDNGFMFDRDKAVGIWKKVSGELQKLDEELKTAFPPKSKLVREITPRMTKNGQTNRTDFRWLDDCSDTILNRFSPDHTFSLIEWEEFNPSSPKQVVARLNEAGWNPTAKTKGHIEAEKAKNEEKLKVYRKTGWKVNEENLETLSEDAPEAARKLVTRLLLEGRRRTLEEWLNAYNKDTGRIHANFMHIGAWTHRMSHNGPNMGNAPSVHSKYKAPLLKQLAKEYGTEMRSCWIASPNTKLIGCDAEGIQMRIFAHYVNDPELIYAVVSGNKENKTDIHNLHMRKLGEVCKDRDDAKTFIYAWLLGAGLAKIALILGCNFGEAKGANQNFLEGYPTLKELKKTQIPRDAARGYFEGIDGRLVPCDNEHLMLAGYLQNGEAIVMKRANVIWKQELNRLGIWYRQVNFVHDEWQIEVDSDPETCDNACRVLENSIKTVGEELGLNCPLAGKAQLGDNWFETH